MHLMKWDWVVMNKQPTLNRSSMIGFQVVLQDAKTFRVSLAVTKPLNADFDGDKINCHVPQNPMATREVKELMAKPFHILSPKNANNFHCTRSPGGYVSVDKEKKANWKIDVRAIFDGSR